jgi:hypothetical protein
VTAGLSGVGVSALFYIMLVLWMPVRELYLTARGKGSVERWKEVGFYWTMTLAIFAVMIVTYISVSAGLAWLQDTETVFGRFLQWCTSGRDIAVNAFNGFGMVMSCLVLFAVMAFTYLLHIATRVGLIEAKCSVPASAFEHAKNNGKA